MTKNLVKALVFSLLFLTAVKASAQDLQTKFLNPSETISVPEGKVIEIVSLIGAVYVAPILNGIRGSGSVFDSRYIPAYICGPAELYLESYWSVMPITYRLKDNVSSTITIPTSAVVIPTDATGPVNVILESSTDLVTWTAANPGTYGASTTKRFFRVRAVNQ